MKTMARMKSITTIEKEIAKTEAELTRIQQKQDELADRLLALQEEKQEYEARQIIEAYKRSDKTLHEMMIFLGA